MRALIFFFISIISILLIISLAAMLLPSKVTVTKSVLINAPKDSVKAQIDDFKNWEKWYPVMQDKSVLIVEDDKKDKGHQTILLRDSSGREIVMKMNKMNGDSLTVAFETISSSKINYEFLLIPHQSGGTQVTLNVNTQFKWYPWQKLKGIMMDKITGPQYELTLDNLKKLVEKGGQSQNK